MSLSYEQRLKYFAHKDRCYCWFHWSKRLLAPFVEFWCRVRYRHKPQHWTLWKCPCLIWWNYGNW